ESTFNRKEECVGYKLKDNGGANTYYGMRENDGSGYIININILFQLSSSLTKHSYFFPVSINANYFSFFVLTWFCQLREHIISGQHGHSYKFVIFILNKYQLATKLANSLVREKG
ncbi:20639_t:CDS:2, partial [Gigaspora rosea]